MFNFFNLWKNENTISPSSEMKQCSDFGTQTSLSDINKIDSNEELRSDESYIESFNEISLPQDFSLDEVKKYFSHYVRVKERDFTYYSGNGAKYVSNEMKHPDRSISQSSYSRTAHDYHKVMFGMCSRFLSKMFKGKSFAEFIDEFKDTNLLGNSYWKFFKYTFIQDENDNKYRVMEKEDGIYTVDNAVTRDFFDPTILIVESIEVSPSCFQYVEFLPDDEEAHKGYTGRFT
jgi:hypothetical protein